MKNNFVVLAHLRSGSTSLYNILYSQHVSIISEPYNSHTTTKYLDYWQNHGFDSSLDLILSEYKGMKHLFEFTSPEENDKIKEKCNTIILHRENMFDAAISLELAFATNVWMKEPQNTSYGSKKITIDAEKVLMHFNQFNKIYYLIDDNCFVVKYEHLYFGKNQKNILHDMFDFIGCRIIDYGEIEKILELSNRLNDRSWRDIVENFDEVKDKIQSMIEEL